MQVMKSFCTVTKTVLSFALTLNVVVNTKANAVEGMIGKPDFAVVNSLTSYQCSIETLLSDVFETIFITGAQGTVESIDCQAENSFFDLAGSFPSSIPFLPSLTEL